MLTATEALANGLGNLSIRNQAIHIHDLMALQRSGGPATGGSVKDTLVHFIVADLGVDPPLSLSKVGQFVCLAWQSGNKELTHVEMWWNQT